MAGIAEEGALAFKEISRTHSNFYHVLDVRHGPIVKIDNNTLVIILFSRSDPLTQAELVNDIRKKTDQVLVFECENFGAPEGRIILPESVSDDISAIYMLYCIQLLALKQALFLGVNPDEPEGLDPWIKL